MQLLWKLLRHHVSIAQMAGFFFANLLGTVIILVGYQFYKDALPCFTGEDNLLKSDFLIVSKSIGVSQLIGQEDNGFSDAAIADLRQQPFVEQVGAFQTCEYRVEASLGMEGNSYFKSEIFLESIPDDFVQVNKRIWRYQQGAKEVPVLLPRSYMTMYNYGFARQHALPRISDGVMGIINMQLTLWGNGTQQKVRGRVVGFTNRLNTILVPMDFLVYTNRLLAPGKHTRPSRLLMTVNNPTDKRLTQYMDESGYEVETDRKEVERATVFLRTLMLLVVSVGILIALLSMYILLLSIYLLIQKNTQKLENLFLIGYSPQQIALPYQLLALLLNATVVLVACGILWVVRAYYTDILLSLCPDTALAGMAPGWVLAGILFVLLAAINYIVVRHRINGIGKRFS